MAVKVRFKGNETFTIREGWINKGLNECKNQEKPFGENYGADSLGVGPNMAKSIRYWLRATELTDRNGQTLSNLGEMILKNDPYVEDPFTLWVLHCNVVRNTFCQATAWDLFFNDFTYQEFTRGQMFEEMKSLAKQLTGDDTPSEKSIESDCDSILHMYLPRKTKDDNPEDKNTSPFSQLGLLQQNEDGYFVKTQPDLDTVSPDVILYCIAELEDVSKGVRIDDLLRIKNGPGKVLNLNYVALMELLEKLQHRGVVTINHTAGLNMVYMNKQISSEDVLNNHYEL